MNPIKLNIPSDHKCSLFSVRYRDLEIKPMRVDETVASVAQTNLPGLNTLYSTQAQHPSLSELQKVWKIKKLYEAERYSDAFAESNFFISEHSSSSLIPEVSEIRMKSAVEMMESAKACYKNGELDEANVACSEIQFVLQHDLSFQNLRQQIVYAKWRQGLIKYAMEKQLWFLAAELNAQFLNEFPQMSWALGNQAQINLVQLADMNSMFSGEVITFSLNVKLQQNDNYKLHFNASKAFLRGNFVLAQTGFETLLKSVEHKEGGGLGDNYYANNYKYLMEMSHKLHGSLNQMDALMKSGNCEKVPEVLDQFFKNLEAAIQRIRIINAGNIGSSGLF